MGFKEVLFGSKPKIMTQEVKDPLKQSVATPLSRFLSEQVGAGVPRFNTEADTRGRILSDLPEGGGGSVSNFLKLNEEDFFNKYVKDPAIGTFRDELLPLIQEDFAGSLSGSGRLRAEMEGVTSLTRNLATARGEFGLKLPAAQFEIASKMKEQQDEERKLQYTDWYKSLPIANPALDKAMSFLSDNTNTGTTVLSFLDQGQKGIIGDVIAALIMGAAAGGAEQLVIQNLHEQLQTSFLQ